MNMMILLKMKNGRKNNTLEVIKLFKIKSFIVPLILIYNLLSISVLLANDDINFNLGRIIDESLISKLDNDIDLKFKNLNLDTELIKLGRVFKKL